MWWGRGYSRGDYIARIYTLILNSIVNDDLKDKESLIHEKYFYEKINELNDDFLDFICEYYGISLEKANETIQNYVRYTILDMASIMHDDGDSIEEYMDEARKMLDRYPMTQAITASDYIYATQFGKVMEFYESFSESL